ncbi:triose-phosphate isomerase [Pseudomonas oryzihabitans]|uniref:Triosephosphate isomerase n=1 Tax=Pseudomonas oryzihabitans TaxID=47885 RepID=A0A1G5PH01_9PSED|nr:MULTISPECIES: triose-phosphate isomerase [Pseudomonas]NMY93042.1 triose-phosphate isomerase [Pseudomonas psychrotolerans]NMZ47813.1 triose-phosphate isomerase [Pseudomonas oryzihabitans]SCZ48340.1 triosephosphate isomerase [Pseudomonas psychrotolerans]
MRRSLVAGNWKMHGSLQGVSALVAGLKGLDGAAGVDVVVIPTLVHLPGVAEALAGTSLMVGAQTCAPVAGEKALTGEVSSTQLAEFGCRYVLVGHSERRALLGEDDVVVAKKFAAIQEGGMIPVLCVGETREEREAERTLDVVGGQLKAVIDAVGVAAFANAVVAYEPVWAIGTGLTATPEQAQEVHAAIRALVREADAGVAEGLQLLYGGSVKAANAAELFGMPDIDGGLVGGASLNAEEFSAICRAAGRG